VVYSVRNADGSTEQKALDFTVAAVNDAPIVVKPLATQTVAEDGVLTVTAATLLSTVDDVDIRTNGQRLRVSSVGDATNGVVMLNTNGDVVFSPNKDFNGNATFRYWVMDDAGASVGVWANVTVTPVNDTPTPLAQSVSILEDEVRSFSTAALIANAALVDVDTVTNADVLKIKSVAMAVGSEQKGSVLLDSNGNVRFTPTANYNGQAVFVYTVADAAGATGSNTFTLNIAPVNDAPTALTPNLRVGGGTEDTVKTIAFADLVKAFTDVDGDALNVRSVTSSFGGQATIQNGQVLFTPNKDFAGDASFSFTVADPSGAIASANATVNFTNVNDAPVAAYKRIDGRALEDVQMRINFSELTSGAFDADGEPVSVKSVSPVSNGNAWIDWAAQQVVFQGASNFNGVARFNYTLADPSGATSTQSVDVGVSAVNDNPTVAPIVRPYGALWEDGEAGWTNNQDPNFYNWIRLKGFVNAVGATDAEEGRALSFGEFSSLNHVQGVQRDGDDVLVLLERHYAGGASFAYRLRDSQGGYADGTLALDVAALNDRPYLVGLPSTVGPQPGWPQTGAFRTGDISARVYGIDVDTPATAIGAGIGTNPLHGNLYLEQAVNWGGPDGKTILGSIPSAWDITYSSQYGDESNDPVGMNIDVWDGQGGWARQYIQTNHTGSRASSGGKPVAIDLNGDGINYADLDDSKVLFDINGDGVKDLLAWTAADDGLIVFDKNSDGIIQDLDEVSFLSYLTGSLTDLEGLNGFDSNKDGKLSAADALWGKFGIWQDKNQNGATDAEEFKGLEAWNIRSIDLKSDQRMDQVGDVYILGKSTYERSDGSKGEIADTAFRYIDGADTSPNSKPKTFNIDIASVIRQRLEDAHNQGATDDELRSMLHKFIADVASAGSKPVDVAASEAVSWSQAMYANPALAEQLIQ
jgi:Cadherin-like domain